MDLDLSLLHFIERPAQITWHVPDGAEIGFALDIFKEIIEPTLTKLEGFLDPGKFLKYIYAQQLLTTFLDRGRA